MLSLLATVKTVVCVMWHNFKTKVISFSMTLSPANSAWLAVSIALVVTVQWRLTYKSLRKV